MVPQSWYLDAAMLVSTILTSVVLSLNLQYTTVLNTLKRVLSFIIIFLNCSNEMYTRNLCQNKILNGPDQAKGKGN